MSRESERDRRFPYLDCPLYKQGNPNCCGFQHDRDRAAAYGQMRKRVTLQIGGKHPRSEPITPFEMGPPVMGVGEWYSPIKRTRALKAALNLKADPPVINHEQLLDQTTPYAAMTPFLPDCPLVKEASKI